MLGCTQCSKHYCEMPFSGLVANPWEQPDPQPNPESGRAGIIGEATLHLRNLANIMRIVGRVSAVIMLFNSRSSLKRPIAREFARLDLA